MTEFASFADEDFCYLTTTGCASGKAHTTARDSDDLTDWARTSLPMAVDLHTG
jgi:hypothetical protein